jgi:adenylate cyclase
VATITWALPGTYIAHAGKVVAYNSILGGIFLVLILPIGIGWGEAWLRSGRRWLQEERPPTDREVTAVLRAPVRLFLVHATLWMVAAAVFTVLNGILDVDLIARVAFTIVLGGLTVSAFTYLLAERILRPLAAAALSITTVARPKLPGVITRTLLGWAFGTAVPLVGLVIVAIFALTTGEATVEQMAVTMLVLGGIGLVVGWWVTVLGARAVADPVKSLRRGISELAEGHLDARVDVYDGSVLGLLQAGFNEMAAGLQEREQLRDLYGRQVGEDVAHLALERGSELGGHVCTVAVLFVDVVGSTEIAASRPPEEVVGLLNGFFGVVVDVVHACGGWVNKFQGDATLAVFGAPVELDDAADRALAAARTLAERLPHEVPELGAGIGVAFGEVVAGNIGDERRFEFTVIGDPVNEASRLTELAKSSTPMVLASADTVEAAGPEEAARWDISGQAELRGRARPTLLARPVPDRHRSEG